MRHELKDLMQSQKEHKDTMAAQMKQMRQEILGALAQAP